MSEPTPAQARVVVAGYDGFAALWAAGEAASQCRGLVLVDVVPWPLTGTALTPGPVLPPVDLAREEESSLREAAERVLAEIVEETRRAWPGLDVRSRVEVGRSADVLASVAAGAELLVIGSSGRTALPRMLLGSTAAELVRTYARPIVVVRHGKELAGGLIVRFGVPGCSGQQQASRDQLSWFWLWAADGGVAGGVNVRGLGLLKTVTSLSFRRQPLQTPDCHDHGPW